MNTKPHNQPRNLSQPTNETDEYARMRESVEAHLKAGDYEALVEECTTDLLVTSRIQYNQINKLLNSRKLNEFSIPRLTDAQHKQAKIIIDSLNLLINHQHKQAGPFNGSVSSWKPLKSGIDYDKFIRELTEDEENILIKAITRLESQAKSR